MDAYARVCYQTTCAARDLPLLIYMMLHSCPSSSSSSFYKRLSISQQQHEQHRNKAAANTSSILGGHQSISLTKQHTHGACALACFVTCVRQVKINFIISQN